MTYAIMTKQYKKYRLIKCFDDELCVDLKVYDNLKINKKVDSMYKRKVALKRTLELQDFTYMEQKELDKLIHESKKARSNAS